MLIAWRKGDKEMENKRYPNQYVWEWLVNNHPNLANRDLLSVLLGIRNACLVSEKDFLLLNEWDETKRILRVLAVSDERRFKEGKPPSYVVTQKGFSIQEYSMKIENNVHIIKQEKWGGYIGTLLGFPPKEVNSFSSNQIKEKVCIHYHGYFSFACEFSRIDEALSYLKETSPVNQDMPGYRPLMITTLYNTLRNGRPSVDEVVFRPEIIQAMTWEEIQYWCQVVKDMREKKGSVV